MTQATDILRPARASETKLIAGVCTAHLVSHYYMVLLAPLFAFIRADYGVSYTELGLALTAFSVVSAVLQTPVGFFVDRTGARINLIGGLLLGAVAVPMAGLVNSFPVFIANVRGAGPRQYRLSSVRLHLALRARRAGARHPRFLLPHLLRHDRRGHRARHAPVHGADGGLARRVSWRLAARRRRGAGRGIIGRIASETCRACVEGASGGGSRRVRGWLALVLSPPILLNLAFFVVLSLVGGGLNQFLVVGLGALHGTPPTIANTALTGLLTMSAIGVLIGGALAARTSHHNIVASTGLIVTAAVSSFIAFADPGAVLLVLVVSLGGFASGMTMPSRDMIVRAVTPPGSFGKVFGFVTSGFHIGGMIAPVIFGQFLDHGMPRAVFLFVACCAVIAIATIGFGMSGRRTGQAAA